MRKHLSAISRAPRTAQTPGGLFLEMITLVIDRLLLAQRQAPWKATGPGDADATDTGTDTGTDTAIDDTII